MVSVHVTPLMLIFKMIKQWGAWVAQSVKCLTLGLGSGHDLMVRGFESHFGLCANSAEPAWDFLSLSLSLSPLCPSHAHSLFLKINTKLNLMKTNQIDSVVNCYSRIVLCVLFADWLSGHCVWNRLFLFDPGWLWGCRLPSLSSP